MIFFIASLAGLLMNIHNVLIGKLVPTELSSLSLIKLTLAFLPVTVIYVFVYNYYYVNFVKDLPYTTLFLIAVGTSVVSSVAIDVAFNGFREFRFTEVMGVLVICFGVWLVTMK